MSTRNDIPTPEAWLLRLFVAGNTSLAQRAYTNLQALCEASLSPGYEIEFIDIKEQPERAAQDQIFAVPVTVRVSPGPEKRIIGDISDSEKVRIALDIPISPDRGGGR